MAVKHDLLFILEYIKINLSTAMEYRTNFILQSIFMLFNDAIWIVFWYFFFNHFKKINDWVLNDIFILFGLAALIFAIASIFFGNWRNVHEIISEGNLDFYLTLPKNELLHILVSKSSFSAWGDLIFGLIFTFGFIDYTLTSLITIITAIITGTILMISFTVLISSLSFFIGSSKGISESGFNIILAFSTYPLNVLEGFLRFLLFFIIPVGFITSVPIYLIKTFNIYLYLSLILVTIIVALVSYSVFKLGLKRYESGSTIQIRI